MTLDTTLLDATRRMTPVIRAHRAHAERARCLAAPVVDAMAEAGLWRLGIPRSLGGVEVDPLTCARVVEEVAQADSVAGWALTLQRHFSALTKFARVESRFFGCKRQK